MPLKVEKNGMVISIIHSNDELILSAFGDDDALLSLAPNSVEIGDSYSFRSENDVLVTSSQSIKSSELREQKCMEHAS